VGSTAFGFGFLVLYLLGTTAVFVNSPCLNRISITDGLRTYFQLKILLSKCVLHLHFQLKILVSTYVLQSYIAGPNILTFEVHAPMIY
jgi:hypothetical protein